MADEDKLVKASVEAAMKPFADLLDKLAGPAAKELGLAFKDHVRLFRLKRQLRLLQQTKEMLQNAGVEPKRVPFKLFFPLIENASIEESDELQDKWAALLASAASGMDIDPGIPEILKQLSPADALFLHFAYDDIDFGSPCHKSTCYLARAHERWSEAVYSHEVANSPNGSDAFYVWQRGSENLQRLGLVGVHREAVHVNYKEKERPMGSDEYLTAFGERFTIACEGPGRVQVKAVKKARP